MGLLEILNLWQVSGKKAVGEKTSGSPSDTKRLNQTTSSILNWLFFKAVGHI